MLASALQQARDARLQILEVMNATIAEPRPEVGRTAPKMVSFEIPIDKIGEVIRPKGKVINAIQAETGADISVDDDGSVGTVSIGSPDKEKVAEAERQIKLILNPPSADVGQIYAGRVVNITKFGAFVNILPGRDGLVHISKMGGGRRIERVEDVLDLGDEIAVRVDDVDPSGKVSLSPVNPLVTGGDGGGDGDSTAPSRPPREEREGREPRRRDRDRGPDVAPAGGPGSGHEEVSFEDSFDAEARQQFGDLGPPVEVGRGSGDRGGDSGARRGGGRRGGGRSGGRPGGSRDRR